MNSLSWIKEVIVKHGFEVPPALNQIIDRGQQDQGPFYFRSADGGAKDTTRMNSMFKAHQVVAFGRRADYDGVICLVIADGAYPKGTVLVLHWDGWPGTEVDEEYPSLASWAAAAEAEISS